MPGGAALAGPTQGLTLCPAVLRLPGLHWGYRFARRRCTCRACTGVNALPGGAALAGPTMGLTFCPAALRLPGLQVM